VSNEVRIVYVALTFDDAKLLRENLSGRVESADETVKFALRNRYPFDEVGFKRETNLFERVLSAIENGFNGRAA
jgi:hypothetical protein